MPGRRLPPDNLRYRISDESPTWRAITFDGDLPSIQFDTSVRTIIAPELSEPDAAITAAQGILLPFFSSLRPGPLSWGLVGGRASAGLILETGDLVAAELMHGLGRWIPLGYYKLALDDLAERSAARWCPWRRIIRVGKPSATHCVSRFQFLSDEFSRGEMADLFVAITGFVIDREAARMDALTVLCSQPDGRLAALDHTHIPLSLVADVHPHWG